MEKQINEKIVEIVTQANDMIPVEWDELYIVIEMDKTYSGESYFYFKYMDKYHYSLDIPEIFSLSLRDILKENKVLYKKSESLKKVFVENDLADWYICVIHVDENNKLSVDFDYSPWLETEFGPYARMDFFMYKYLGITPTNPDDLAKIKPMEEFYAKHNG